MQAYLTNAQLREADETAMNFGVPAEVLMKRAGRAIADEVQAAAERLQAKNVLVVCGIGNNGGDGYVAAAELLKRGINVAVYAIDGNLSTGCKREKKRYTGKYVRTVNADIIVDCIFGTGLNRKLQGEFASVVKKINAGKAYVISADLPSGLNGDNGEVMGVAVKANLTVALGEPKIGCVLGDGLEYSGTLVKKDIGIVAQNGCAYSVGDEEIAKYFPVRRRNTHKGDYGAACVIAGSEKYLGAAALAVSSALKSGCGYMYAQVPQGLKYALAAKYPQCIFVDTAPLDCQAIAVGMGMDCTQQTYDTVCALLKNYKGKLIIDADGLNALAKFGLEPLKQTKAKVILTPHVGEMSRLCGISKEKILQNPVEVAQKFATEYNVVVHLKNAVSITVDATKATLTLRGNSALAKAGSGDILSGLICGNAARGLSVADAAICSSYVLGCSAEICSESMYEGAVISDDLILNIHNAIKRITCAN